MNELHIQDSDRILIIAPHADDESIGCGGFISMYAKQIDILLLTDGRNGRGGTFLRYTEEEYIKLREREIKTVVSSVGIHALFKLDIPDGKVYLNHRKIVEFDFSPYKYVFVPNHLESHPDHREVLRALNCIKARRKLRRSLLIEYEVWTPMPDPNIFYDISLVSDRKKSMIGLYRSQIETTDYVNKSLALNEYRGINIHARYAEAYSTYTIKWRLRCLFSRLPMRWKIKILPYVQKWQGKIK